MKAVDIVYHEAELLDDRRYDAWASLFADDCRYWAPYDWNAPEPRNAVNIIYDDRARLEDRVSRLTGGDFHSQDPPSQTSRLIETPRKIESVGWAPEAGFDVVVTASFHLTELRREDLTRYAGRYTWWLLEGEHGPAIAAKKVQLLGADLPLSNLTFPL